MGTFYKENEEKIRAGVYKRYSTDDRNTAAAIDGVGAVVVQADWGPVNKVLELRNSSRLANDLTANYGTGGTVDVAKSMIDGGISVLYVCRLGTGGTQASVELENSVTLKTIYPTAANLSVTVREKLGDNTQKELVLYEDTAVKETITFAAGENDAANLVAAINNESAYILAEGGKAVTGTISTVSQKPLEGGANPTVTNESYSAAFDALEPYDYNVIALDTVEETVQALLRNYIFAAEQEGKHCLAVMGATGVSFAERTRRAKACNGYPIVFFGSAYGNRDGADIEGARAVAEAAGVIASTPSNQSMVHTKMPTAATISERLTNAQYEAAINNGLLLLSVGTGGEIWFDSGINTLTEPTDNQDNGWKKIKRAKVRMEMFRRIDLAIEPLVGKVDGGADGDGVNAVIQQADKVLEAMAGERKIAAPYSFEIDPDHAPTSDSAWFVISVYDVDTLEKMYLHYKFRYQNNN